MPIIHPFRLQSRWSESRLRLPIDSSYCQRSPHIHRLSDSAYRHPGLESGEYVHAWWSGLRMRHRWRWCCM